jgi:chromosomal replication initiator protein
MYLSRKYTDSSLQIIGKEFNRDHATVLHSVKKIEKQIKISSKFRSQMEYLTNQLEKKKWQS